jgi:hypothetical protein
MTGETRRLWAKVVVAIASPSYRAIAGWEDGRAAARREAAGLAPAMSAPAPQSTDEPRSGNETPQVHAAV